MPQIINKSYFNKENGLFIPLAVVNPVPNGVQVSPNNSNIVDNLCVQIEKDLLIKALGLTLYKELQTALGNLDANPKWKKLVEGDEYGEKSWKGLKSEFSFIAYRVLETYLTENSDQLTALGTVKGKAKNAVIVTPNYRITKANNLFLKGYQGSYMEEPVKIGYFTDWYGQEDYDVSLYTYLVDKHTEFPTWDVTKFYVFGVSDTINSFGI